VAGALAMTLEADPSFEISFHSFYFFRKNASDMGSLATKWDFMKGHLDFIQKKSGFVNEKWLSPRKNVVFRGI